MFWSCFGLVMVLVWSCLSTVRADKFHIIVSGWGGPPSPPAGFFPCLRRCVSVKPDPSFSFLFPQRDPVTPTHRRVLSPSDPLAPRILPTDDDGACPVHTRVRHRVGDGHRRAGGGHPVDPERALQQKDKHLHHVVRQRRLEHRNLCRRHTLHAGAYRIQLPVWPESMLCVMFFGRFLMFISFRISWQCAAPHTRRIHTTHAARVPWGRSS